MDLKPKIIEIREKSKKINKKDFISFVNDSLNQIENINNLYIKIFEKTENKESLISDIESIFANIQSKYNDLFNPNEQNISKINELEQKITEIKNYHKDLLEDSNSIKADIKKSQDKIAEFFVYLFGNPNGEKGQEEIIKTVIESIKQFNFELNQENGIKSSIENAKKTIIDAYDDLFTIKTEGLSKHQVLSQTIETIEKYKEKIDQKIDPYITKTQDKIGEIETDIKTKGNEINSLLSQATVKTLAQGYLESMSIYGYVPQPNPKNILKIIYKNIKLSTKNVLIIFFNYILFISPLILIGLIFAKPTLLEEITGIKDLIDLSSQHLGYKISISTPLLWISWFGQRNISQRKRIFEEYNHKLRVVQMYLMFTSKNSYKLKNEKMDKLEDILLDVIKRNPCKFFGKDLDLKSNIIVEIINALKGNNNKNTKDNKKIKTGDLNNTN